MDSLTATFGAFADPTRRSLLRRLTEGPLSVSELASSYRLTQQAISKHLAALERAGLIQKKSLGRQRLCTLQAERFKEAADWVADYRLLWENRLERLDECLREMKKEQAGKPAGNKP